jgi:hypothetical protein
MKYIPQVIKSAFARVEESRGVENNYPGNQGTTRGVF